MHEARCITISSFSISAFFLALFTRFATVLGMRLPGQPPQSNGTTIISASFGYFKNASILFVKEFTHPNPLHRSLAKSHWMMPMSFTLLSIALVPEELEAHDACHYEAYPAQARKARKKAGAARKHRHDGGGQHEGSDDYAAAYPSARVLKLLCDGLQPVVDKAYPYLLAERPSYESIDVRGQLEGGLHKLLELLPALCCDDLRGELLLCHPREYEGLWDPPHVDFRVELPSDALYYHHRLLQK